MTYISDMTVRLSSYGCSLVSQFTDNSLFRLSNVPKKDYTASCCRTGYLRPSWKTIDAPYELHCSNLEARNMSPER